MVSSTAAGPAARPAHESSPRFKYTHRQHVCRRGRTAGCLDAVACPTPREHSSHRAVANSGRGTVRRLQQRAKVLPVMSCLYLLHSRHTDPLGETACAFESAHRARAAGHLVRTIGNRAAARLPVHTCPLGSSTTASSFVPELPACCSRARNRPVLPAVGLLTTSARSARFPGARCHCRFQSAEEGPRWPQSAPDLGCRRLHFMHYRLGMGTVGLPLPRRVRGACCGRPTADSRNCHPQLCRSRAHAVVRIQRLEPSQPTRAELLKPLRT